MAEVMPQLLWQTGWVCGKAGTWIGQSPEHPPCCRAQHSLGAGARLSEGAVLSDRTEGKFYQQCSGFILCQIKSPLQTETTVNKEQTWAALTHRPCKTTTPPVSGLGIVCSPELAQQELWKQFYLVLFRHSHSHLKLMNSGSFLWVWPTTDTLLL